MVKKIIIALVIIAAAAFVGYQLIFAGRIPENNLYAVGNTAGNLNNKGLFCEDDGVVYFSNPYDGGTLYSMNPDLTDFKKIWNNRVQYLNAEGDYLYYYQGEDHVGVNLIGRIRGVYRLDKKGEKAFCYTRDAARVVQLSGNHLFFQHYTEDEGTTLYKASIDNKTNEEVLDYAANPAAAQKGVLYFNGVEGDHRLYSYDIISGAVSMVYDGDVWFPAVDGDYIYYLNVADNYSICRYSLADGSVMTLTADRTDFFNVHQGYVYYQTAGDAPALKRMGIDGSNPEVVMEGVFTNINAAGPYIFFQPFNAEIPMYKMPAAGEINITEFTEARDAVVKDS